MSNEVAVVNTALTSIGGTLEEKTKAFQQIGACASSGLFPAGYNEVPKIVAACWFADGLGIHPTAYMEGVQPVQFGGKTVREPKWEFVNALLRSRLPGFDYEVHEDSDVACDITFVATGRKPQRVRYTMEQAAKQGLADKDTYKKNPRQMLWKQCFKMGADRIGADALAGLPPMVQEAEEVAETNGAPQPTVAELVENTIREAEKNVPQPPPPPPIEKPHAYLGKLLVKMYGPQKKDVMAGKVSFLWNSMIEAETGVNPNQEFKKADELGPADAERLCRFIEARVSVKAAAAARADESPAPGNPEPATPPPDDDAPPPMEAEPPRRTRETAYEELHVVVARAKKLLAPRVFIQEAPAGGGVFWFVDEPVLKQTGDSQALKVMKAGTVVPTIEKLEHITRILAQMCDEKERGGR